MLDRETIAFMRRSLATGRVSDGVRPLARAGRSSLFRLRKKTLGVRASPNDEPGEVRAFPGGSVAIEGPAAECAAFLDDRERILGDAAAQAAGVLRLAGGRTHRLAGSGLDGIRDPEDRHAYHRLYWLLRRAKAIYCGGGSSGFIDGWREWAADEARHGREALAAYTTGERICSLEETLFWTAGADLSRIRTEISEQIWSDACRMEAKVEYSLGVHNHILQNGRALLRAARCFGHAGQAFRDQGLEIGERFWPALVDPAGVLREQSSHYHVLLSRAALDYLHFGGGRSGLSPSVRSRLKRMFDLTNDLVGSGGGIPRFGDSSPDATAADLRGLSMAAWRLGAMARPPRDRSFTTLTLYYAEPVRDEPPVAQPAPHNVFEGSGFAFLRSADGRLEAAIHADPRPEAFGHGNCARGAFELSWDGAPLIREPGAFRDSSHCRYRLQRSPKGHNVCRIDDLPPALDADTKRRFPAWYGNGVGALRTESDGTFAYIWRGFQRAYPGVSMERRWRVSPGGGFRFEERIGGGGRRHFESRLHLGDVVCTELTLVDGRHRLACSGPDEGFAAILEIDVSNGLQVALEPSWVAPEYGVEAPAIAIVIQGAVEFPCRWGLEIEVFDRRAHGVPKDRSMTDALTVEAR